MSKADPKTSGGGMMKMLVPAILMLVVGVAGGWWYFGGIHAAESDAPVAVPPVYMPLEPPFVVNLYDGAYVRYLKVDVELMARGTEALALVQAHEPAVRNALVMLFSSGDYSVLMTRAGKEALQAEALAAVNAEITRHRAAAEVESLYFTGFVIQ